MLCDVTECYICNGDKRLSFTATKWIEHAPISYSIRLLLLLGSNVDTPPQRVVDFNVLIGNVGDLAT